MYYSAIGVLAVLILLIVNQDILRNPKTSYDKPAWKVYRRFLFAVLAYYITDILWGIIESQKMARLLFIDTTVYFIAMAVGILFWAEYTVAYLEMNSIHGRLLVLSGRLLAAIVSFVAIVNTFKPILFSVDSDCVYQALPVRYVLLTIQIVLLLLISVYAFISMFRHGKARKYQRYRILGSFGFIMALLLFVQLWFPYLPLYSVGYMLGTSLLHTFVAADEKEEHKRELMETKKITELNDTISALLNNMPGMAFTKDAQTGVYLACNQSFAEYAKKEKTEDVVGLTDAEIFDAETAARLLEDDRTALSLSKPYIFFEDVPDAAGEQRQLQTTKVKYKDTLGRICVLGICQDVTDMVRIQHEHAMTKEAYEKAVSSGLLYNNIAVTLARDYIDMYYINTDSEEYIEYKISEDNSTLSEIRRGWHFFSDCRKELAESVFEDDRDAFMMALKRKTLMKILSRKDTFAMTYRQMDAGSMVYVNMKISRMEDEKYIIMGITNVDAEIRETMAKNKSLADALDRAEKANREKTTVVAEMIRRIRTPLNAIIGFDTFALKNDAIDSRTRKYLEEIAQSSNELLEAINDMHDVIRPESENETPKDEVKPEDTAEEKIVRKEDLYVLVVDDDPIEAKYSGAVIKEAGIRADFCTSGQEALHMIEKQYNKKQPYNLVLMDWNMPGMNGQETTAEIRKLYGKDITVAVLTAYDWDDIQEEVQVVGVENYIQKPLLVSNVSEKIEKIGIHSISEENEEKPTANLSGRRILLAEDVDLNAGILVDSLEMENIKVDHAINGRVAVDLFEKSTEGIYAAILMDVRMPVMDGLEAARVIRSMDRADAKRIPIIALTAKTFEDDIQRSMQSGMNAHLSKPIEIDELVRVLGEQVYEAERL